MGTDDRKPIRDDPCNPWSMPASEAGDTGEFLPAIPRPLRVLGFCRLRNLGSCATQAARGTALAKEGKYEQAIAHYRAAIRLNPGLPGIHPFRSWQGKQRVCP